MVEYRKDSLPKKSTAMKILSAYGGGVTNLTEGVEYTAFGRDMEVLRFNQTLKMTANSSGKMEAFIGPYGVGKSFILALFQNLAIKKGFVVMSADITKHCWLAGTAYDKQGLNLYRELIKNTAIKGKPTSAFDTILERWYNELSEQTGGNLSSILYEFDKATRDCKDLPMYDDIRGAVHTRFREFYHENEHSKAMSFFLANITRKTDAADVGARDYIRESGWFNILNTFSHIFVKAGYKGLIILIDQADYLLNLPKQNRQQNYEYMLSMWNAVNEGRTEYLSVCLFAADPLLDDERKGTASYVALDDRLSGAIRLEILNPEQLLGLLKKLKEIHEYAYGWESEITDEEIVTFVNDSLKNMNMTKNCVRPISVAWIHYLDDRQVGKDEEIDQYTELAGTQATEEPQEETESDEFPDD